MADDAPRQFLKVITHAQSTAAAVVSSSSARFSYVTQRPSVKSAAFEGTIHYFVVIQVDPTLRFVQNPIIYLESLAGKSAATNAERTLESNKAGDFRQ